MAFVTSPPTNCLSRLYVAVGGSPVGGGGEAGGGEGGGGGGADEHCDVTSSELEKTVPSRAPVMIATCSPGEQEIDMVVLEPTFAVTELGPDAFTTSYVTCVMEGSEEVVVAWHWYSPGWVLAAQE